MIIAINKNGEMRTVKLDIHKKDGKTVIKDENGENWSIYDFMNIESVISMTQEERDMLK